MSAQVQTAVRRLCAPDIQARKGQTPLVCLTAHSSAIAVLLDDVCDLILVGDWTPRFVRRYADLRGVIQEAVQGYARDVRERSFPGRAETYFNVPAVSAS